MSAEQDFLDWLHQAIPLSQAMQVRDLSFDGKSVSLSAPLSPNINDKGTGFAAATSGLATLTGWTLLTLWLKERNIEADVMIAKSELSYLAPVRADFRAEANFSDENQVADFLKKIERVGRARIPIRVYIGQSTAPELILQGDYVAVRRTDRQ